MSGTLTVGFMALNHLPLWLAVTLGLALGGATGLINGLVVAYFKIPSFIVTLAMLNVARGVAYVYSGGHSTRMMDPTFTGIGSGYLWVFPLPVLYMVGAHRDLRGSAQSHEVRDLRLRDRRQQRVRAALRACRSRRSRS